MGPKLSTAPTANPSSDSASKKDDEDVEEGFLHNASTSELELMLKKVKCG